MADTRPITSTNGRILGRVLVPLLAVAAVLAAVTPVAAGGDGGEIAMQAGALAVVKPKFEGSKDYDVTGAPIVGPAGGNGDGPVQFKGIDDLRFRLIDRGGLEAGPLIGYRFDRNEDDSERLSGLGDVDGGVVVGGYAAYRMGLLKPYLSYHHQVTGDDTGGIARLGVEARLPVAARVAVTATGGVTWADDDYMRSYFGVSAAQNVASGLAAFDAGAGVKDVFIGLATDVPLGERWSLKLSGRYAHLLGDAAASPIVETESQWQGAVGLSYRFGVGR